MELPVAKKAFLKIVKELDNNEKLPFLRWIFDEWSLKDLTSDNTDADESVLYSIAEELRRKIPLEGVLPSEKIYEPTVLEMPSSKRWDSGTSLADWSYIVPIAPSLPSCNDCLRSILPRFCFSREKSNDAKQIHVDEFLYDDRMLDTLVDKGKLSLYYCKKCGSSDVDSKEIISHSSSVNLMKFIFKALLPPIDELTFLDVGSRFGAALFGAYVFTKAKRIVGIEMNPELCLLAKNVVLKREMADRIEIIQADVLTQAKMVSEANVIFLNNMFEYFADKSTGQICWRFLYDNITSGSILLISPPAPITFATYDIGLPWQNWLTEHPLFNENPAGVTDLEALKETVCAYKVMKDTHRVRFVDTPQVELI